MFCVLFKLFLGRKGRHSHRLKRMKQLLYCIPRPLIGEGCRGWKMGTWKLKRAVTPASETEGLTPLKRSRKA